MICIPEEDVCLTFFQLVMLRVFSKVSCIGTVGLVTGSYALYRHNTILFAQCESNQPNITNTKSTIGNGTGFGSKLFNGCLDIYNKLSDGEIFHELRRKEVQMELLIIVAPLIFGAFTSYRIYLKKVKTQKQAMMKWNNKDFHDIINISLNTIVRSRFATSKGSVCGNPYSYNLHYRTLVEKSAFEIINDSEGINLLISTMQECSKTDTEVIFIEGKHKDDRDAHWAICSAIMNQISNLCSYGYIYRDLILFDKLNKSNNKEYYDMDNLDDNDLGIVSCDYILALTCEGSKYIVSKTNKIRVICINKQMLQLIIDDYKQYINKDLKLISNEEWLSNLDNIYKKDMFRDWNKKRWLLIKKIAEIYDGQMKINN